MVQFCCVVGCGNRSNREYMRFFRLPALKKRTDITSAKAELILKRRRQWLENIARVDLKDGDSNYSPGYIRVCSDHFITGEPSELTDVDHPDWAPTLKMGHGQIRMKGNLHKRIMLGFPLPEKKKHRKRKKNSGLGRKRAESNQLSILVKDPDECEIEQRKMLAVETEYAEKKKKYKPVKNPYARRRKRPPPEIELQQLQARKQVIKSFIHRKEPPLEIKMQLIHARDQQIRTFMQRKKQVYSKQDTQKRAFMQRNKQMYMKQTTQKRWPGQSTNEIESNFTPVSVDQWFRGFMGEILDTPQVNTSDSDDSCTPYVSPLIHKITKDVVVNDEDVSKHFDTTGESNSEIMHVDRCVEKLLYNSIKREDDDESLYISLNPEDKDESLHNKIKLENENESLHNTIKLEDYESESSDNDIESEDFEDESLNISTHSTDYIQLTYPSADEERLLQELMNGHLQEVKEEIKLEHGEVECK